MSVIKISRMHEMKDLGAEQCQGGAIRFRAMIPFLGTSSAGSLAFSAPARISFSRTSLSNNSCLRCTATSDLVVDYRQLGMAEASDPGIAENGGGVASSRISLVLEMALQSSTTWGPQTFGRGNSGADLSHGHRKSDLGSTAYPWRIANLVSTFRSRRFRDGSNECLGTRSWLGAG